MQTRARSIIQLSYWLSTPVMTFRRFASPSLIREDGVASGEEKRIEGKEDGKQNARVLRGEKGEIGERGEVNQRGLNRRARSLRACAAVCKCHLSKRAPCLTLRKRDVGRQPAVMYFT